ncbi:MAG: hypothetical protein TR69_WS6001001506 [candidate division WS6 bacterium OLB20]|uniref:Uncharacterized protein n=1 Tax=candidate division WS6 bacterium OLB20 TaxID=1617426 RepID=A0A136LVL5_9BACT|nr:MAG: hypothetical protein TR69_WS6001001506 [candidate division WS6 bacterium OLB20]
MAERESKYTEKAIRFGALGAVMLGVAGFVLGAAGGIAHEAIDLRDTDIFRKKTTSRTINAMLRTKLERRSR